MKSLFITGTDTSVGKTVCAAAWLANARARGIDAVPMKPVQTGGLRRGGRWVAPDLERCLRAGRITPSPKEREWMAPYIYRPACSPHLAAQQAQRPIRLDRIERCFRSLAQRHEMVIVEGAGGALVPLGRRHTMLDLMVRLALPVVLVARPGLGTINHTLLSLRALRGANLTVRGIVLAHSQPGRIGRIERDNARILERLGGVPILARLPYAAQAGALPRWRNSP